MSRPTILIHNTETNEVIEREMTVAEFKVYEANQAAQAEAKAAAQAEAEAKAEQKAALLERLGITAEEAQLLLG